MYVDPNSGGMLFQILAVVFGFFSAVILFFSGRIRLLIARLRRKLREGSQAGSAKMPAKDEISPPQ